MTKENLLIWQEEYLILKAANNNALESNVKGFVDFISMKLNTIQYPILPVNEGQNLGKILYALKQYMLIELRSEITGEYINKSTTRDNQRLIKRRENVILEIISLIDENEGTI